MAPSYKVLVTTFAKQSEFHSGCATALAVHTTVLWFDTASEATVAANAINKNEKRIPGVTQTAVVLF